MKVQLKVLLFRMSIAMAGASLLRLIFLVFNSYFLGFEGAEILQAFVYGLLYDISALTYLNGLLIFIHLLPLRVITGKQGAAISFVLFVLVQLLFTLFNLIDTGYFSMAGKRSGIELFFMAEETNGLKGDYLLDYWYLLLILLLVLAIEIYFYRRTEKYLQKNAAESETTSGITKKIVSESVWRLFVLAFAFLAARGGFQLIPLNTFDAARQTRAELVPLVVNTPFNMLMSTQQTGMPPINWMQEEEALKWFNPYKKLDGVQQKRNVVLIVVESLGKDYMGYFNHDKTYTPFLDSLCTVSDVYMHMYANGKRSIEGIPAIVGGMPTWMQTPYISSFYQGNKMYGIGKYLQQMGYHCGFYHGGHNGTMSFDNFIAQSGSGFYSGLNEYDGSPEDISKWGVYDKPYLQFFSGNISHSDTPFFHTVFTLSSHHPFELPETEKHLYKEGTLPIHKTILYADDALRNFFQRASKAAWYKNTTFIITADHSSTNEHARFESLAGRYEVPLLIFRPYVSMGASMENTVSQADIEEMILKECGYHGNIFSWSTWQKQNAAMEFALQYQDGFYLGTHWPFVIQYADGKPFGFYKLDADPEMKQNLLNNTGLKPIQDSMSMMLSAMVQLYHNKLKGNATVPQP